MPIHLQRITTAYSVEEDRIRVAGECEDGSSQVLWLTLRLAQRLVPVLLQWLDREGIQGTAADHAELMHGFAQQAAEQALAPQDPVQPGSTAWLVNAVDVTPDSQSVTLRWRSAASEEALLAFNVEQLRQWLAGVRAAYVLADWPLAVWPAWMGEQTAAQHDSQQLLH